jgi:polyisoprenoid-binding protein YceI
MGKDYDMRRSLNYAMFLSCVVLLSRTNSSLAADGYNIDPAHTSIVFSVSHSALSYTYGFFREVAGSYIIDKQNPANCRFRLVIQTNSLDTNNAKRDDHLRSADFFNVAQFPEIVFDSTKCEQASSPDGGIVYKLTGNLTMHGVTKPITFMLRMLGEGQGPYKDQRTGFLCQIELKRSDFGMTYLIDNNLVGDAVGITVSFEGSQQEQQAAPAPSRAGSTRQ